MDGSGYSPNVITTSTQYSSTESPTNLPHTLPPLQQHPNGLMQPNYNSYPHTPRTPATPNTPGSASTMGGNYPPPPTTAAGRSYQMMANNAYQASQPYPTSSAMIPQTSAALSHPQPIAPAPSPGTRAPPVLRPMPTGGVVAQQGMGSPYGQGQMMPQPSMLSEGEPTHVVGSQGRRGILPSAPGRPTAPAAGSAPAKTQMPQKDADGKFPCPHCNKTYLHAKHLKRHLLRHTGDRPYMCVLCRDTFSRSDILKRHFQKCSIRRGNPTGVSHLSHPHAHVKKNQAAQKTLSEGGDLNHMNGMGNMPTDGTNMPFGLVATPEGMANDQNQLSRTNNLSRLEEANERDRRNAAGAGRGNFDQQYNGSAPPNSMAANMGSQLTSYNLATNQNGMPIFPGQNSSQPPGMDWSSMFQAGAHATATYLYAFPPNDGQTQIGIKADLSAAEPARPSGIPAESHPHDADRSLFFASWGSAKLQDPYQELSRRLIDFLATPEYTTHAETADMMSFFSAENIREYLEKYTHFHVHFAILHIPTFHVLDSYTGLLAGMCCVGACYSDRVSADHVRNMLIFLKAALERGSDMLSGLDNPTGSNVKDEGVPFGTSDRDIEELQAVVLMHTLLVWNGTPSQREDARQVFPLIAHLARRARLLSVCNDPTLCSLYHQPGLSLDAASASSFDWRMWIQQEKRIRIILAIFSVDVALGLFFNSAPLFDPMEIRIPLASDDAAWEAQDPTECARSLGLYGAEAAASQNPDGTQRVKQIEMHLALRALLHRSYQIQMGTTNLYGKFILIHSLLALIRKAQLDGHAAILNRSSTPLGPNDWVIGQSQEMTSAHGSGNTSGRTTPIEGVLPQQTLGLFAAALEKFKRTWDFDMAKQFPPSSVNPRRHGFSRDGVHYYWLANYLLRNTRTVDLMMAPDQRFAQVIRLLKSVKSWVMRDGASRGEELGSVGEIDDDFGVQNPTLNMVDLFRPLPRVVESAGISSVKAEVD